MRASSHETSHEIYEFRIHSMYQSVSESADDTKKQTNIGVISTGTTMGILSVFGVALTGWSFFNSAANRGFLRRKRSKTIRYPDLKI